MNNDLFSPMPAAPLAELMRPQTLDDVVGQKHLLGENGPVKLAIASDKIHSMILWGPPGTGKTTLAKLIASASSSYFTALSAVSAGVKEIRLAIEQAQQKLQQHQLPSLLFIDEIHRFNKSQQDVLLPFIESGLLTLIGATTENPSFEINSALLSRVQVYLLNQLDQNNLLQLLERARQTIASNYQFDEHFAQTVVAYANGDARRMLNFFERVVAASKVKQTTCLTVSLCQQLGARHTQLFDKNGDHLYDLISALHKAVRGSNPNAALYWLCRLLVGGADPYYLIRRIVRMAWEDIGLADPRAFQIVNDAAASFERLGLPEGELALAQAVIYLACSPKSNAGYQAYRQVKEFVESEQSYNVPSHLKNTPTQLSKQLGYDKAYRYPHDEAFAYAAGESYLPDEIKTKTWYFPTAYGLENKIQEKLKRLKDLDDNWYRAQNKKNL